MKRTATRSTIIPAGYTGKNFNAWVRQIQAPLDKIHGTKVKEKLK